MLADAARPPAKPRRAEEGASGGGTVDPVLRLLLLGVRDPASPLHAIDSDCARRIYLMWRQWVDAHLDFDGVHASVISGCTINHEKRTGGRIPRVIVPVNFPPPRDRVVNMMPVRMGDLTSIPEDLQDYAELLTSCPAWVAPPRAEPPGARGEHERIGYLTVHESRVEEDGATQRRKGLHTETPGVIYPGEQLSHGAGGTWGAPRDPLSITVAWGGGYFERGSSEKGARGMFKGARGMFHGGLYMASTVAHSTRVWNCRVRTPGAVVGALGDIELLRARLGAGTTLEANELLWMTDATPHESLPLPAGTYRQYFRLSLIHI